MAYPITMTLADVLSWAAEYEGPRFHAFLSDPPYHLTEITKRFGAEGAAPAQFGSDGAFQRASRGFMGQQWDGGDIAFRPETWAALAQHLHPGAFGMAFASSRGWHRMAVAIEDAGLIIHPVILCWSFGSGFPKATKPADQYTAGRLREWLRNHPDALAELRAAQQAVRKAKQGDTAEARTAYQQTKRRLLEAAGLTRVVGQQKHAPKFSGVVEHGYREKDNGFNSPERETFDVVEYLDPIAAALKGHRYGLQALKPALEPVIVFQKPYDGRAIDNIVETGAGVLNVDGGRLPTDGEVLHQPQSDPAQRGGVVGSDLGISRASREQMNAAQRASIERTMTMGRWPANLALVHSPACADECVPECPVHRLGAQSGETQSKASMRGVGLTSSPVDGAGDPEFDTLRGHSDTGTAARYFYNGDWMYERLELADQVGYFAKASRAEREAGLDPMQVELMRLLADDDEGEGDDLDLDDFELTTVDDGRQTPIDNPYQRGETERRNTHPTIKPLSLTRWLATLLLPPDLFAPRRLLVPFAGTGSEAIGGMLAGWDHVQGIELGEGHVQIAHARIAYWHQRMGQLTGGRPIKVKAAPRPKKGATAINLSLFDPAPRGTL